MALTILTTKGGISISNIVVVQIVTELIIKVSLMTDLFLDIETIVIIVVNLAKKIFTVVLTVKVVTLTRLWLVIRRPRLKYLRTVLMLWMITIVIEIINYLPQTILKDHQKSENTR